jgi:predicted metal-dependent hydrolase
MEPRKMDSLEPQVGVGHRDGDVVYFLGRACRLSVTHSVWKRVRLEADVLHVSLAHDTDSQRVRRLVDEWFVRQAREALPHCFAEAVARHGWRLRHARVPLVLRAPGQPCGLRLTVRPMRSRWGSCSMDGHVTLSAELVRLPQRLVEYVAVHELCHLVHHNHSAAFYFQVATCLPDWRQRRAELRAVAHSQARDKT